MQLESFENAYASLASCAAISSAFALFSSSVVNFSSCGIRKLQPFYKCFLFEHYSLINNSWAGI